MPNIIGGFRIVRASPQNGTGAFSTTMGTHWGAGDDTADSAGTVSFSAANSNSIYGASTTVQPPTITLIPQIKF